MSPANRTGLRLAAAGTAAALALAAGAPAFAQDETAQAPSGPAGTESTAADSTENEATEAEERQDPEGPAEAPGPQAWSHGAVYRYADQHIEGANMGTAVTARPEFMVDEAAPDPELTAATILVFTATVDRDDLLLHDERNPTYNGYPAPGYDNCTVWEWGATCILTDFAPEAGQAYTPSEATPLTFEITGEVTAADAAPYHAVDVDAAGLEAALAEPGAHYDLDGDDRFSLVETDGSGIWHSGYGMFLFESDPVRPELPTEEEPALPVTGGSATVLVSSAAAALLAGAVVSAVFRRRRTAGNWE
ncbi:LPXTG cell wall anchor domain-containing protein [Glycomyces sp. MUSA5-2]|uniref:LPXTG cell wall anchor domain-containing protein n=1 Tax=Glycomyces sp. MUSA5-2 TaxID=2053002 RepID=UPI0030084541